jgi:hypothetical protein
LPFRPAEGAIPDGKPKGKPGGAHEAQGRRIE